MTYSKNFFTDSFDLLERHLPGQSWSITNIGTDLEVTPRGASFGADKLLIRTALSNEGATTRRPIFVMEIYKNGGALSRVTTPYQKLYYDESNQSLFWNHFFSITCNLPVFQRRNFNLIGVGVNEKAFSGKIELEPAEFTFYRICPESSLYYDEVTNSELLELSQTIDGVLGL